MSDSATFHHLPRKGLMRRRLKTIIALLISVAVIALITAVFAWSVGDEWNTVSSLFVAAFSIVVAITTFLRLRKEK